ncbi:Eukaryotic aspartyl protease [Plasmodium yoelii yoelii]|uniref:Eukaryotic aspartyl protease n=1 Tax=Plasmodium yoelii yoelii TaxID=73239 RepID=Q7RS93_PLAYO|nr:Eukaryotic aspartyl protease [Plasmodium yoelii yoelii]
MRNKNHLLVIDKHRYTFGAQFQQKWGFGQVCIKESSDDIISLLSFQYIYMRVKIIIFITDCFPLFLFKIVDILGIRKEKQPYMNERKDEVIVKYEGFHDGSNRSIVDTGTFLIYAPKKTMENYLNDLTINSCEDKHKLPYIIFQIKSKEIESIKGLSVIELVLSPNDYVIEYIDEVNSTKECIIGIQSDEDNINGWTLGQVFLKSYYTIFDKDNLQIGFVRNKQTLNDETYLNESFLRVNKKRNKKKSYNGPLKQ